MKVLLLGATGRTGRLTLEKLLESGYQIHCLARNSTRIESQKGITVFEGNPANKEDLEKAISGCDAVVSVLNISRSSDFPWSKLRTPENYLSNVISVLVSIAEEHELKRIIICSAWGVSDTKNDLPVWFKWLIDHSNIGIAYKDHERQEKIITESKPDWTIVRPVGLSNSKKKEQIRETFDNSPRPSLMVSRQSVAHFLAESIKRKDLIGEKVVISKA